MALGRQTLLSSYAPTQTQSTTATPWRQQVRRHSRKALCTPGGRRRVGGLWTPRHAAWTWTTRAPSAAAASSLDGIHSSAALVVPMPETLSSSAPHVGLALHAYKACTAFPSPHAASMADCARVIGMESPVSEASAAAATGGELDDELLMVNRSLLIQIQHACNAMQTL
jgi:hypothetical protein